MPASRFKVTFWYPRWRSLKLWKGHVFNIPKKVTKNCQVDKPSLIIHLWVKYQKITQPKPSNPRFSVARPTAPASSLRSGAVCFFRHPQRLVVVERKNADVHLLFWEVAFVCICWQKLLPWKVRCQWENHHFLIGDISLNAGFCTVTVVFQDVVCCFFCETDTFTPFSFAMAIVFDNNFFDSRNRFLENRFLFNMYFSNWGFWKKQSCLWN